MCMSKGTRDGRSCGWSRRSASRDAADTVGSELTKSVGSRQSTAKNGLTRGRASSSGKKLALAVAVRCDDEQMYVTFDDGRVLTAPLTKRLRAATPAQRRNCVVDDFGTGLHWEDADEDLGVNWVLGVPEDELEAFAGFTNDPPRD